MSNDNGNKYLTFLGTLIHPVHTPLSFGPKILPFNYIINAQKTGTILVMYLLMLYYKNFSLGAYIYLSLHGTYGLIWFLKDMVFPDKSFQTYLTIPGTLMTAALLLLYWFIGFEMMSGLGDQEPSGKKIFICFLLYIFGILLMMLSDFQKFLEICVYKKHLVDGFFLAKNRNTNYLGEILIYLSFAMINGRVEGFLLLGVVWVFAFSLRIYMKELSLRKKKGYEVYRRKSYVILFKFFERDLYNVMLYLMIVIFIIICYI